MAVHIRRAERPDAAAIAAVLAGAFREFEPLYTPGGYSATTPTAGEIEARWGEGPVWVANEGAEVVGTVGAVERGGEVYVRSMAVLPSARGRGVAGDMLRAVEEFARGRGARRMTLSTTPFLTQAIALYERWGFRREAGTLDLCGTELWGMVKELVDRR